LLAVWFSLPSILVSFFLWMPNLLSFYSANGFLIGPQLLYLVPTLGFGLSFMLCLVLAIRLPLIWAREQATLRVHWPDVLASMRDENSERFDFSEEETLPARAGKDFRLPILACCGLLCHLLIFLSLSFPYIDYVDPYGYILDSARYRDAVQPIATTGWQLLGEGFQPPTLPRAAILPPLSPPLAIAILAALILPALIYLACLLLLPVSGPWKDNRLRESIFLSNMFTLIGLGISSIWLLSSWFSYGGDLHDPFQDTDIAFAILPVAFLLSLICSRALLSYFRHRIEKMLH
jgi:hypothetical protein